MTETPLPRPEKDRMRSSIPPCDDRPCQDRQALNKRIRSVQGSLIAGSAVGTIAFSALAGYESISVSEVDSDSAGALTTEQSVQQGTAVDFFASQAITGLGMASTTAGEIAGSELAESEDASTTSPKASIALADVGEPDPSASASAGETDPFLATGSPPPANAGLPPPPPPPPSGDADSALPPPPPPDASTHPST